MTATESSESLKARMRDYFHRAYTLGDASAIDEMIATDVLNHGLAPQPERGREAFKRWYTAFRGAFSNVDCKLTHCFVEGDWVTARVLFIADHTGASLGHPPSGRRITLTALVLCRFQNGQAVEGYNEFDQVSLLKQLGAM